MAAQTDLWGDIIQAEVRTPVAILREQASLLGIKTKNLIEASVKTSVKGGEFRHSFRLVVPALDGYTYELFEIFHGVSIYPITVPNRVGNLEAPGLRLKDEEAFLNWLGHQLSSNETKRIISNLLAQATT